MGNYHSIQKALPQVSTNGVSAWGTPSAGFLPKFLTNNPLPNGYPWGLNNVTTTNPYTSSPNSGVTRYYDLTVTRGVYAPDGYEKEMIVVNNQYPGPLIEANWGDTIQVTVHNNITGPEEPTSMHWHGFLQSTSQWMDGVPGFSQCPIVPFESFTYSFKAELYGTTWYHAHYSSQYADGVIGPMVIYGPNEDNYDIDVGPIMLSDYYHSSYESLVDFTMSPNTAPPILTSDNSLINGKGDYDCSLKSVNDTAGCTDDAGLSSFSFTSGKVHMLRLVNPGAEAAVQFSIDEHEMTVVANDFVPVNAYTTNVVTLGVGQRADVLVTGTGSSSSAYYMRSNLTCSQSTSPFGLAIIYYEDASADTVPFPNPQVYTPGCDNDALNVTVPSYVIPASDPGTTITIDMAVGPNATLNWEWTMNNSSYRADLNSPVLLLAAQGNVSYPDPELNVYNVGTNGTYRFIVNNLSPAPHPMHFHGHNMQILSVAGGTNVSQAVWDGSIINADNPQRRDVQLVPGFGYFVWQTNADNPGTWPFHCHIAWHLSAGLSIDIIEAPDSIPSLGVPSTMYDACRAWGSYTDTVIVDQIDSGL